MFELFVWNKLIVLCKRIFDHTNHSILTNISQLFIIRGPSTITYWETVIPFIPPIIIPLNLVINVFHCSISYFWSMQCIMIWDSECRTMGHSLQSFILRMRKISSKHMIQNEELITSLSQILKVLDFVVSVIHKFFYKERCISIVSNHHIWFHEVCNEATYSREMGCLICYIPLRHHVHLMITLFIISLTWVRTNRLLLKQFKLCMHAINSALFSGWYQAVLLFTFNTKHYSAAQDSIVWHERRIVVWLKKKIGRITAVLLLSVTYEGRERISS